MWHKFLRAHAHLRDTLEAELEAERGIQISWYEVLLYLAWSGDGRMRLQELAGHVLYSRSGLTRLVDRMEKAGLVERVPCPDDRRGTFAAITPEGRRVFRRAAPVHMRGIEQHFLGHLSADDISALGSILDRLLEPSGR
ncbi:MAG: MarR family transcriptional regulator [Dehalococcoidia bacterium]